MNPISVSGGMGNEAVEVALAHANWEYDNPGETKLH